MDDEFRLQIEYPVPPKHLLYECLISIPFAEKFLELQKYQNIQVTPWNVGQYRQEQQRSVGYDVPFFSHLVQKEVVYRVTESQKHFLTRENEVVFISNFSCQQVGAPESPSPFVWVCEWTVKPSSPKESNSARFLGESFTGKLDAKAFSNLLSHCTIEGKVKKPILARGGVGKGMVEIMEFATGWTEGHTKSFLKSIEKHFLQKDAYNALSSKISGNFDYLESVYESPSPSPTPPLPVAPSNLNLNGTNGGSSIAKATMYEMPDEEEDEDEEIGSFVGTNGAVAAVQQSGLLAVPQAEEDAGSESSIHSFLANSPHQQTKIHSIQQEMTQLKGLVLSGRGDTQSLTQRIQAIETQLSGLANGHPPSSGSTSSSPPLPSMIPSFSSSPPLLSSSPGSLPLTGDGERVEQLQRQITLSRQRDIEIQNNTTNTISHCQNDLQKQRFFLGGVAFFALCWPVLYSFSPRILAFLRSKYNDFFQS